MGFAFIEDLYKHALVSFEYGSNVYGTQTMFSDEDLVIIVDDTIDLSEYPDGIFTEKTYDKDIQFINNKTFINMLYNHHITALESLWMNPEFYSDYKKFHELYDKYFILDKNKLRVTISSICNNAWVKCKKKLIVEKDYDAYRAAKSMFHSLRLYMFGYQIATQGKITDYECANDLWFNEIFPNYETYTWEDYYNKFKPLYNELHSKFVKVAPKI